MSQQIHDARLFAKEITKYLDASSAGKRITPKVSALFSKLSKTAGGAHMALVESAVALTQQEKRSIEKILCEKTKTSVSLEFRVNSELLTGVKIHVGELLLDWSGQAMLMDSVRTLSV